MGRQSKPVVPAEPPPQHRNITPHIQDQADRPAYPQRPPSFRPGPHYPPVNASHPQDQNKFIPRTNLPRHTPDAVPRPASPQLPVDQVRRQPIIQPSIDDYIAPASEFFAGRRDANSQRQHGMTQYLGDWNAVWERMARNDARSGHGSRGGNGIGKSHSFHGVVCEGLIVRVIGSSKL